MNKLKTAIRSTRPQFLLLTPVCVFLGSASAMADGARIEPALLDTSSSHDYVLYRQNLDVFAIGLNDL